MANIIKNFLPTTFLLLIKIQQNKIKSSTGIPDKHKKTPHGINLAELFFTKYLQPLTDCHKRNWEPAPNNPKI
jgi:hypothetical protein